MKTCWLAARCVVLAAALLVVGVALFAAVSFAFFAIVETPGAKRFNRYCDYPNKDALLSAETNDVVRCHNCTIRGTNVTLVVVKPCRWLASGPVVLVYDADGKRIGKTRDEGDDGRFQQMWSNAWRKSLRDETLYWLRMTRLPEPHLFAPSTMAEFAAYMEQASKDFDRPDKSKDKRGIRFRCCESAAQVVFPEKLKSEQPFIETLHSGDVSFWDALTNACERTGCTYRIYGGKVDICNCK